MIFSMKIYPYNFEFNPPDLNLTYSYHIRVNATLWHLVLFISDHLGRTPFLTLDNPEAYGRIKLGKKKKKKCLLNHNKLQMENFLLKVESCKSIHKYKFIRRLFFYTDPSSFVLYFYLIAHPLFEQQGK